MPPLITHLLIAVFVLYALVVALDTLHFRSARIFLAEAGAGIAAFLILHWSVGFPAPREAFSATSPLMAILIMFICVVLGIMARNIFYQRGKFTLKSFLRPLVISPIVLLPLIGALQSSAEVEAIQLICLAILAFQNGFFWKTVFDNARLTT